MRKLLYAALCAAVLPVAAHAQNYPTKPVRFIVPFPPGGGNDTIARLVGQKLSVALGQQVIVDNRPGAGGTIGAEAAARSPGDGYTMFLAGVATHGINPNMRKKLPYDALKDFEAVSLIASAPLLVVVHPSLPVKSVKDLITTAKTKPGQINYASNGPGSSSHLAGELFDMMAGVKMTHVPYKGLAPALTDLLSGEVSVMFSSAVAALPQVKAGRLRAIAMTGAKRSPAIPNVPTVAEAGLPGYETGSWYGVVVPAGTPRAAIDRLSREIQTIVKSPELTAKLNEEAVIPVGSTPEAFNKHIRNELARWAKVVKAAKLEQQ
ncbi:MAG TPA: tripartite tricarboxylate transporter substrate binding protein [Burkholderiales bacterium]|nr:tripartite tricarboxylate transporter substrate binding protein [Burkholderiales bacterium]